MKRIEKKILVGIIALAASFAAYTLHAEYNEISTDFPMTGPTTFTAASGVTNVYTGLISGTGPAIIEGGGTVAFAHPNNTYTGGTTVNSAVFRLDADGCAGTAGITGTVETAHVYLNCANVPNDLIFNAGADNISLLAPGAYPAAKQYMLFPMRSEVSVKGLVAFNGQSYIYDSTSPALVSPYPTVTYEKGITNVHSKFTHLHLIPFGRMIFKGPYTAVGVVGGYFGYKNDAKGAIEFHASSNILWRANLFNANVDFRAVDAFPSTLFYYENGGDGYCKMILNGNDQTLLGFSWKTTVTPGESGKGQCITSDAPATVRIKGCEMSRVAGSLVNRLALFGNVSLVMDVDSTYTDAGFYQDFSVRQSTTTGDLIISNGDFRVSSTASFPNVPNIYVGEGGSFSNASTKANAFAGCRNLTVLGNMACTGDATPFGYGTMALTLGSDATFSLPAGATVTVKSFNVGGFAMPDDTYGDGGTPIAQLKQGTVVVRSGNIYVDCVSGNDANDGTAGHPFKTIQAATSSAISGDVIYVAEGVYGEAEGTASHHASAKSLCRVIIPANVSVVASGRRERTFIVGAPAPAGSGNIHGNGPGAVRCVYANDGALLRGFTLTGGHTDTNMVSNAVLDNYGAAFRSANSGGAAIEDCIVSNNYSHVGTLTYANVRRCRIIGNFGGSGLDANYGFVAGSTCSYIGCIVDGNTGANVFGAPTRIESCTTGKNNKKYGGGAAAVTWGTSQLILNSVFLGSNDPYSGTLYATNCIFARNVSLPYGRNCLVGKSDAEINVDADYKPIPGSVAIDFGDNDLQSPGLGSEDIYGTPRVLNVKIDAGAVEYDWRPEFGRELGKRFKVESVSPSVTTNAAGGLLVSGGVVAGKAVSAGPYEISFDVVGGTLAVYVGGELVGESAGTGEQSIRFKVPDATDEIRFAVDAPGSVVLKKFSGARGFSISFR